MKTTNKEVVYGEICGEMKKDGYKESAFIIPKVKVFLVGTVISLVPAALFFFIYRVLYGVQPDFALDYPIFLIQTILSLIVHELVHGMGWMLSGNCKWSEIQFGISSLFPYCYCKKPLSRNQYFIGVMMPLILLGIGSLILALSFKSLSILVFAVINVIIAGGDLIIAFSIRKVTKRSLVIDHPYEAGFVAFQE